MGLDRQSNKQIEESKTSFSLTNSTSTTFTSMSLISQSSSSTNSSVTSSASLSEKKKALNYLSTLPQDLMRHKLMPFLNNEDVIQLSCSGKEIYKDLSGPRLLQYIADGNEKAAAYIIKNSYKKNPELLEFKGTVKDKSGRTIQSVTPFELAFGAEDVEMCEMILSYMSDEEKKDALEKVKEKFPESKEEKYDFKPLVNAINTLKNGCDLHIRTKLPEEKERKENINSYFLVQEKLYYVKQDGTTEEAKMNSVTQFTNTLSSINKNNADNLHLTPAQLIELIKSNGGYDPIESALNQFREDFKPGVIKKGKHFNIQPLIDAMDVYNTNYDSWTEDQLSLFWCKVIGYLERLLPVCYTQAFCQGLYNVTDGRQPLKRSGGPSFYPADLYLHSGLGFDFGVYSYYLVFCTLSLRGDFHLESLGCFKAYVGAKTAALQNLCNIRTIQNRASV